MTVQFEQILAPGIAQCSYLLGDTDTGTAAVVDPRPDAGIYIDRARALGLAITHVFETHIHADFLSGARELAARLDGHPRLCLSVEGGATYGFDHDPVRDGDRFQFGGVSLTAVHTPGHTPEHLAFLLREKGQDDPWGVLSGDALFVGSVGRPDLLGKDETDRLAQDLFATTRDIFMALPDGVLVYPCHGAGSACGPDIGDRMVTSIGHERRHNKYARIGSAAAFRKAVLGDAPPVPSHYPRLKKANAAGPAIQHGLPRAPALTAEGFADCLSDERVQLLDTRDMLAFGGGFIPGALNIGLRPELSVWAGWLLDPGRPIALVVEDDPDVAAALTLLWRVGFTDFAGYLAQGMSGWREGGRALDHIRQLPVQEMEAAKVVPLDVRSDAEWQAGRIPGARHAFLGHLPDGLGDLDRSKHYATYCASGFRASIAASLLSRAGFRVSNIPGSFRAWTAAGCEVEAAA